MEKRLMITNIANVTNSFNWPEMKKMEQTILTINKEKYEIYTIQPVFHLLYSQRVSENKSER